MCLGDGGPFFWSFEGFSSLASEFGYSGSTPGVGRLFQGIRPRGPCPWVVPKSNMPCNEAIAPDLKKASEHTMSNAAL